MDAALAAELASIIEGARAHLEREADLAAPGLPVAAAIERLAQHAAAARSQAARVEPQLADVRVPVVVAPKAVAVTGDKHSALLQLATSASTCTDCVLHEKRKQSVFSRGNPDAELVFVGEGPGAEEDRFGEPFVGPAGQLLDRMITAMGYARDEVYICNVVKCRPPENRTPRPEEAIACAKYLVPQIDLVKPTLIVALGRCAAENLGVAPPEGSWRGRFGSYRGIPVMPTYHPAYLLRSPEQKRVVWDDLKLVMQRLGRTPPERKS